MKQINIKPYIRIATMLRITVLLVILLPTACGLKRSNPIDPLGNNNVIVPNPVTGIVTRASNAGQNPKFYAVKWTPNSMANTDGYYVYMGQGYTSEYILDGTVLNLSGVPEIEFFKSNVMPGDYFIRVSAYKEYNGRILEGPRSSPFWVRVPN